MNLEKRWAKAGTQLQSSQNEKNDTEDRHKLRALPCGLRSTGPRASVPARAAAFVPTSLTCGPPPRPPQKPLIVNCPLNDSLESKREAPISWPGMGEREGTPAGADFRQPHPEIYCAGVSFPAVPAPKRLCESGALL